MDPDMIQRSQFHIFETFIYTLVALDRVAVP